MKIHIVLTSVALILGGLATAQAQARPASEERHTTSRVAQSLEDAAEKNQFTFVVIARGDSAASRAMVQIVQAGVDERPDQAQLVSMDATDASEQGVIEQFGLTRAPMPVTVAVAPNGAITGVFPKAIKPEQIASAIVPPTMMKCMKALQDKKLVFVCLTSDARKPAVVPAAVRELQADPAYAERMVTLSMRADDPVEARFAEQLKIKGTRNPVPALALVAPPGVLVGHFGPQATAASIIAGIEKAERCCDDPNCKHHKTAGATGPAKVSAPAKAPAKRK